MTDQNPDLEQARLRRIIESDPERMQALQHVYAIDLPDAWIAAGFVRNAVWDALHSYAATPLNDIDVIYFDPCEDHGHLAQQMQQHLQMRAPNCRWQVKNQAFMHLRNQDPPYLSCADAMTYWPEKETAVAVRWQGQKIEILAPFGLKSLLAGQITRNPRRTEALFRSRVESKGWLVRWPHLRLKNE